MPIQLTKIMADGGVNYLLDTVANDQARTAMDYYTTPGNTPGVWMGDGCARLGVKSGQVASKNQVSNLFTRLTGPNGEKLTNQSQPDRKTDGTAVSGFDLTFTIPKSVSILWAVADDRTRRTIMRCHYEAIDETMRWWQDEVASTRVGRGGISQMKVKGVTAVRFDHWDTREHDPHLHSHVTVSNIVERVDGGWGTLDGRTVYRAQVNASEKHANILLDRLVQELGLDFRERVDPSEDSKAVVMNVEGVPDELIRRFSTRGMQTEAAFDRLVAQWEEDHGAPPSYKERAALKEQAFQQARRAKDKEVLPLGELIARWVQQARELGYDPETILSETLDRGSQAFNAATLAASGDLTDRLSWLLLTQMKEREQQGMQPDDMTDDAAQLVDQIEEEAADLVTGAVRRNATTISRWQVNSAVERLTRQIRCDPEARQKFTDAISAKVVERLVPVNPHRYEVSDELIADPRIGDGMSSALADNALLDTYVAPRLLDAERHLFDLADKHQEGWNPDRATVEDMVREYSERMEEEEGHGMAGDQAKAAVGLLAGDGMILALTGPAGTGKTTTMRAVKQTYDRLAGEGKVIGMATSAKAAAELGNSLQIPTNTVAKILMDEKTGAAQKRREDIARIEERRKDPDWHNLLERERDDRTLARLYAERESCEIPQDGIVIVDEASMTSTMDLHDLARLCEARNARLILTGDPHQLAAPGEGGGFLGWLERTGRDMKLTSVWRFMKRSVDEHGETHTEVNSQEVEAGLALRDGVMDEPKGTGRDRSSTPAATRLYANLPDADGNLIQNATESGRIHGGDGTSMQDKAFERTLDSLANGGNSLLIVATNESVTVMNDRITTILQARGIVDANPMARIGLSDGLTAGKGDVIVTRRNQRRIKDQKGGFVKNGDMWTVDEVLQDGGLRLSRRDDASMSVTVNPDYVREGCELGYAVTAHRAQGMTVDQGNLWVPDGASITRELLYVALTRGRYCNDIWIDTPDMQDLKDSYDYRQWRQVNQARFEAEGRAYTDDDLNPTPLQLAESKFSAMARSSGEPITATESIERNRAEVKGIERLVDERDLYADMITEPRLIAACADRLGERAAEAMKEGTAWERLLNVWTKAQAIDPENTSRIMDDMATLTGRMEGSGDKLFDVPDIHGVARNVADRLAREIVEPVEGSDLGWLHGLAPIDASADNEADMRARSMMEQTERMIRDHDEAMDRERIASLTGEHAPTWMERMPDMPVENGEEFDAWRRLVLDVDRFRSDWNVRTAAPLGPYTTQRDERRRKRQWSNLRKRIVDMTDDTTVSSDAMQAEQPDLTPKPANPDVNVRNMRTIGTSGESLAAARLARTNRLVWEHWMEGTDDTWVSESAHAHGLAGNMAAYAPAGRTVTLDWALRHGIPMQDMVQAGLVEKTTRGEYIDRFRDRMMMPVFDGHGDIVAFCAMANPRTKPAGMRPWTVTEDTSIHTVGQDLYGDGPRTRDMLAEGGRSVWCATPLDAAAMMAVAETMQRDGMTASPLVPLASCAALPMEGQFETVRTVQGGKIAVPVMCYGTNRHGMAMTDRAWGMLQPGERMTASGLVLPADTPEPARMVEAGRGQELAELLAQPRPLSECMTDRLADDTDFADRTARAEFPDKVGHIIVDALPEQVKANALAYAQQVMDERSDIADVGDADRVRLPISLPPQASIAVDSVPGIQ